MRTLDNEHNLLFISIIINMPFIIFLNCIDRRALNTFRVIRLMVLSLSLATTITNDPYLVVDNDNLKLCRVERFFFSFGFSCHGPTTNEMRLNVIVCWFSVGSVNLIYFDIEVCVVLFAVILFFRFCFLFRKSPLLNGRLLRFDIYPSKWCTYDIIPFQIFEYSMVDNNNKNNNSEGYCRQCFSIYFSLLDTILSPVRIVYVKFHLNRYVIV